MPESPVGANRSNTAHEHEELADLLSDPHCRLLLEYLKQRRGPISVSAATRHIVAEITEAPPADVPDPVVRRVQTWLHLGQLPLLEDYGIVEFDAESGTVALRDDVG